MAFTRRLRRECRHNSQYEHRRVQRPATCTCSAGTYINMLTDPTQYEGQSPRKSYGYTARCRELVDRNWIFYWRLHLVGYEPSERSHAADSCRKASGVWVDNRMIT